MNNDEAKQQLKIYIQNLALINGDLAEYLSLLKRTNIEFNEKMLDEINKIRDAIVKLDQLSLS